MSSRFRTIPFGLPVLPAMVIALICLQQLVPASAAWTAAWSRLPAATFQSSLRPRSPHSTGFSLQKDVPKGARRRKGLHAENSLVADDNVAGDDSVQPTETTSTSGSADTTSNSPPPQPDLLDYFDPLLSPHSYPKGIDAGASTAVDDVPPPVNNVAESSYDMLGWGASSASSSSSSQPSQGWNSKSRKLKVFGIDNFIDSVTVGPASKKVTDVATVFDPTLSPHMYTKGLVPSIIVGDAPAATQSSIDDAKRADGPQENKAATAAAVALSAVQPKTIGVLIVDHGSRNAASNQRLHALAQLYQQEQDATTTAKATSTNKLVVQAAHMEIATPSIADGIQQLLQHDDKVDEIVIHPYFLSPGRHVTEDIPALVAAAVQDLNVTIPVRITPPVGSLTDTMLTAIHTLIVQEPIKDDKS